MATRYCITAHKLRELAIYDPETGVFMRRITRGNKSSWRAGTVMGNLDHQTGYTRISIDRVSYHAHRLAWLYMYGTFPSRYIDHIDGDGSNNRISNLREATQSQNMQNQWLPHSNNTSGYLGVGWHKQRNKWRARIAMADGKQIHLGLFATREQAAAAYLKAKATHHIGAEPR